MTNCPGSMEICSKPDPNFILFFFSCSQLFYQKNNSNKLTHQDTQNELYHLHLGKEGFYEEQSGEQISSPVLPLFAVCLYGDYHWKCSCFQLLFPLRKGGWADNKLVPPNKLLPAVPHRRMNETEKYFGMAGFCLFVFLRLLRSFQVQEG